MMTLVKFFEARPRLTAALIFARDFFALMALIMMCYGILVFGGV